MGKGLCTICGAFTLKAPRCAAHPRRSHEPGKRTHTDPRWTALSRRMIAHHVGQFGWVCPGDGIEHAAHPTRDLTLDHVVQLQEGGAEFDAANTRVLCRMWNSTLGARLAVALRRTA